MDKSNWDEQTEAKVLYAFLKEGKSHKKIQEEILKTDGPTSGGEPEAMKILHNYGIDCNKKGKLASSDIATELTIAEGGYKKALELLSQYY